MGRMAMRVSDHSTRYYWYPGEKREWVRGLVSIIIGIVVFAVVALASNVLAAAVVGCSVTAAIAGANFGRRDSRALAGLPDPAVKVVRREAVAHAGRAAWRGVVEGVGGASAAVLIINLPSDGMVANWLLPVVPVIIGALAHQGGMLYERLGHASGSASALDRPRRTALTPAK